MGALFVTTFSVDFMILARTGTVISGAGGGGATRLSSPEFGHNYPFLTNEIYIVTLPEITHCGHYFKLMPRTGAPLIIAPFICIPGSVILAFPKSRGRMGYEPSTNGLQVFPCLQ